MAQYHFGQLRCRCDDILLVIWGCTLSSVDWLREGYSAGGGARHRALTGRRAGT